MSKVQSKDAFLYDLNGDAGELKIALREAMDLGSAAELDATEFASAGQGGKADTAIQPDDLVTETVDGLMTAADKLKLNGVAAGATQNAADAALRDRTTHTGEQAMATITGLVAALAAKATPADISAAISSLVNSSPAALDTLSELATALGNDPNFATATATALGNRLRVDTAAQGLDATQKSNGRANLDVPAKSEALTVDTASAPLALNILKLLPLGYVNPEWWGFSASAAASANTTALTNALAENEKVDPPRGLFKLATFTHVLAEGADCVIDGGGAHASIFNFGSDNGAEIQISAAASQMQADKTLIQVTGLSFQTELSSGAGVGLHINYPDSLAGTDAGSSVRRILRDLSFSGRLADAKYWGSGLKITNGSYFDLENIYGSGPESGVGGTLVNVLGNKNSVDNTFRNLRGRNLSILANVAGRFEGLTFDNPIAVDCSNGLKWYATLDSGETAQPWCRVSGGHFNVTGRAMDFDNVTQIKVQGTVIYLSANNAMGIYANRSAATEGVANNSFTEIEVQNKGSFTGQAGIQLGQYTGNSIISNNRVTGMNNGIVLLTNSNGNIGSSNLSTSTGSNGLVNNGTNNSVSVTVL
ncbi:hypothetical protein GOZ94_00390 [Agrobacterium vitis]|uniref:hypothetical protein n=1 Tax=Agrobacterium vitis TaxID=373 RepID=UPI0012E97F4E|nr:hypothetical protein [Agrobacterium vitis]MVA17402.1 hypothetical protein [Agrobacterium vitis]